MVGVVALASRTVLIVAVAALTGAVEAQLLLLAAVRLLWKLLVLSPCVEVQTAAGVQVGAG